MELARRGRSGLGDISSPTHLLRGTNATVSKKLGVNPKIAADQRGHGLGVSLAVYTDSDLDQKKEAVGKLESGVIRKQGLKQLRVRLLVCLNRTTQPPRRRPPDRKEVKNAQRC